MPVVGVMVALDIPCEVPGCYGDPAHVTCHSSPSAPDSSPESLQTLSASSVLASATTIATSSALPLSNFKQGQPGSAFLLPVSAPLHHGHPCWLGGVEAAGHSLAPTCAWPWKVGELPAEWIFDQGETGPRINPSNFLHSTVLWPFIMSVSSSSGPLGPLEFAI